MSRTVYAVDQGEFAMLDPPAKGEVMLDVHAPEHPISGRREFLLHLFTITCGLLIALGLENGAEVLHHRHERVEAEESIRRELEENREAAQKAAPVVMHELKMLQGLLVFVQARSEGVQAPAPDLADFGFSETEIPDAAWRTASSTGVLSFMEYAQVERFAGAYREQELLQHQEQQALSDMLQLNSFFSRDRPATVLTAEQAKEALPYVRRALADVTGILAVGAGTLASYESALK